MKLNFKIKVLPLVLLTVLSQTACVDPETKQLKANQDCQTSKEETYKFSFIGFLDPKKVTFREIANDKFLYEKTIGLNDIRLNSYGFGTDLNLIDGKFVIIYSSGFPSLPIAFWLGRKSNLFPLPWPFTP